MSTVCKNCGNVFEGNYCNNCGQAANTHKIDHHFIWHDIQHGLMHYDNGVMYSGIQLFTRPGYAVKEYIKGMRVKHFKPISMAIVLSIVYGLVYHLLGINLFADVHDDVFQWEYLNEWVAHHYYYIVLLSIPFFSLGSYMMFKKHGYNFTEHLIINAFYSSQKLIAGILSLPFLYFYHSHEDISHLSTVLLVVNFLLMYWTYSQVFAGESKINAFFRTLFSYVLSFIMLCIVVTVLLVVFFRQP